MLEVMGKRSFFLGEVGQGAKMKLVINMVRQHGSWRPVARDPPG